MRASAAGASPPETTIREDALRNPQYDGKRTADSGRNPRTFVDSMRAADTVSAAAGKNGINVLKKRLAVILVGKTIATRSRSAMQILDSLSGTTSG